MAQNKIQGIGPAFVANAVANILNGAVTSMAGPVGITIAQPVLYLRRIRLTNKTASTVNGITLYIGATGASASGTEFAFAGISIPANSSVDWTGFRRLESTQFLTGVAGTASAIVIEGDVEVGIS